MLHRFLPALWIGCWTLGAAAEEAVQPFPVRWPRKVDDAVGVGFLLEAPAGRDGFLRVENGRLVRPDGRRFRIWGINATGQTTIPPQADAPVVAAHLARLGINCVRFHFLDRPAPAGLVAADRDDSRVLDAGQLDKLDCFVAELKRRGIYADLNLNVSRRYKSGDGVRDAEQLGYGKGATYFDRRLLELQREYAAQLLTHRNPYTGNEYRREPAVALVELVNENSLVEAWRNNRLTGEKTTIIPGTWSDLPASYARDLTEQFNAWLARRRSADERKQLRAEAGVPADAPLPRLRREQFAAASALRFRSEVEFYLETERNYLLETAMFLRDSLGVRVPLVGNSDHDHYQSGYPIVAGTSLLDVVDGHVYWQHPKYVTDEKTGKNVGFFIANTPMVDDPLRSSIVQLSRTAVAGKPFTVSEFDHPFPSEYACEGIPILAAYAALQDWDGVFGYTLCHRDVLAEEPRIAGHFDFARNPVKLSQLAAGSLMFLRGDVRPARRTVERSYSHEQVIESIRMPSSERPLFTPGLPQSTPLRHALRVSSLSGPPTGSFETEADDAGPITSDTGELTWNYGEKRSGTVTINTPRSQALVGFVAGKATDAVQLPADLAPAFCAVTLGALDDEPIDRSRRLLLTATARVANTGMQWNDRRTTLTDWGRAPTVIETVRGAVQLRKLVGATAVAAQPLDGDGRPTGEPIQAVRNGDVWTLRLGARPTTWYLLTVAR